MRGTQKGNYRQPSQSPDVKPRKKQRNSRRLAPKSLPSSQSSADVPVAAKKKVKSTQNNRCWFCLRKAHKTLRPLEISHVFPQASSKRTLFETHHKRGRLHMLNIHSTANLIEVCSVCHYAFDLEQWTLIPDSMSAWVQAANAEPEKEFILIWNSQRDI